MLLVLNQSPFSTVFSIVRFSVCAKTVLSGDPLYLQSCFFNEKERECVAQVHDASGENAVMWCVVGEGISDVSDAQKSFIFRTQSQLCSFKVMEVKNLIFCHPFNSILATLHDCKEHNLFCITFFKVIFCN